MSATRRLVAEKRDDGTTRVLSLPLVRWEIYDQPPPEPSAEELMDEIRLLLADAQIEPQPLISLACDRQIRLIWPRDLERLAEGVVLALAPEIRRSRRARRSARTRSPEPPEPAVKKPTTRKRKEVRSRRIEVEQKPDGRWVVSPSDASERLVVPASVLDAVRRHADEVNARQPGHEAFGALVVGDDGEVLRYTRLANAARTPGHVRIASARQLQRRPDGHALISSHSHPRAAAAPSPRDIESAIRYGWSLFAIHGVDGLRLWAPDDDGGCREVAFDVW